MKNKLKKVTNITSELLTSLDEQNKFVCHACLSINNLEDLICQDQECTESAVKNMKNVSEFHD